MAIIDPILEAWHSPTGTGRCRRTTAGSAGPAAADALLGDREWRKL